MPVMGYQEHVRTIDETLIRIEDVPQNTEIGRLYKRVLDWQNDYSEAGRSYRKLTEQESALQEKIEAADIQNTTPEEFALLKAEHELTSRTALKLKPKVEYFAREVAVIEATLFRLQGEHSNDLGLYQDKRKRREMSDEKAVALKRRILQRYCEPETIAELL